MAQLDEYKHAYLVGYLGCSQFTEPQRVLFYLDSCSTVTTLLDIDVVRLRLNYRGLKQTTSNTAIGEAYPYILPNVTVFLKNLLSNKIEKLKPFPLKVIHLLPPDDPTTIVPVQYEFGFSLIGMDILSKFKTWNMDYKNKKAVLES